MGHVRFALRMAAGVMLGPWIASVATAGSPAEVVPADVFLLVAAPDVSAAVTRLRRMSIYGLYKDPAMQPFMAQAEKVVRELVGKNKKLREAWRSIGFRTQPSSLPWPRGRVVLAMRMGSKTVRYPVYDMENYDGTGTPEIKEYRMRQEPAVDVVILADMGEGKNLADAKRLLAEIAAGKAANGWTHTFQGGTYVGSSDAALLADVLALMSGESRASLAENRDYAGIFDRLGSGDAMVYLNVKRYLKPSPAVGKSAAQRQSDRMYEALGLDSISAMGCVLQLAPRPGEQWRIKALLRTDDGVTGLAGVLVPPSIDTRPGGGLTGLAAGFLIANYDPPRLYDQLGKLVLKAIGVDMDGQIRMVMMFMAANFKQPLDIRKDLLGRLRSPVTLTTSQTGDSMRTLVSVPVQGDGAALDATISRLHGMFVRGSGKDKKQRRRLRGRTVYLLPLAKVFGAFMPIAQPPAGEQLPSAAMAVAGRNLVIGSLDAVEQAIGDLDRKDVKNANAKNAKNAKNIRTDPMYARASRFLPDRAGIYFYRNERRIGGADWSRMKKAARAAAGRGREPPSDKLTIRIGTEGLMMSLFTTLGRYCDFTTLPDYEVVGKYWGTSVGYVVRRDDGIYAEIVAVSAPRPGKNP